MAAIPDISLVVVGIKRELSGKGTRYRQRGYQVNGGLVGQLVGADSASGKLRGVYGADLQGAARNAGTVKQNLGVRDGRVSN